MIKLTYSNAGAVFYLNTSGIEAIKATDSYCGGSRVTAFRGDGIEVKEAPEEVLALIKEPTP